MHLLKSPYQKRAEDTITVSCEDGSGERTENHGGEERAVRKE